MIKLLSVGNIPHLLKKIIYFKESVREGEGRGTEKEGETNLSMPHGELRH